MKVEQFLNLYRIAICYSLGDFPMLLQIYFPVVNLLLVIVASQQIEQRRETVIYADHFFVSGSGHKGSVKSDSFRYEIGIISALQSFLLFIKRLLHQLLQMRGSVLYGAQTVGAEGENKKAV